MQGYKETLKHYYIFKIYFICEYLTYIQVCVQFACNSPWRLAKGTRAPNTIVKDYYKQPCGFWESNLCPLEDPSTLLNTEPFLKPQLCHFKILDNTWLLTILSCDSQAIN